MPGKIRWSARATFEWSEILNYWTNRNKSFSYSIKLNRLIKQTLNTLKKSLESGIISDYPAVRIKLFGNYLIFYQTSEEFIEIITIGIVAEILKNLNCSCCQFIYLHK